MLRGGKVPTFSIGTLARVEFMNCISYIIVRNLNPACIYQMCVKWCIFEARDFDFRGKSEHTMHGFLH